MYSIAAFCDQQPSMRCVVSGKQRLRAFHFSRQLVHVCVLFIGSREKNTSSVVPLPHTAHYG